MYLPYKSFILYKLSTLIFTIFKEKSLASILNFVLFIYSFRFLFSLSCRWCTRRGIGGSSTITWRIWYSARGGICISSAARAVVGLGNGLRTRVGIGSTSSASSSIGNSLRTGIGIGITSTIGNSFGVGVCVGRAVTKSTKSVRSIWMTWSSRGYCEEDAQYDKDLHVSCCWRGPNYLTIPEKLKFCLVGLPFIAAERSVIAQKNNKKQTDIN